LEKQKEACKNSQNGYCPLYHEEIVNYILDNFVNVEP
jgi:hypothetical protein